MPTATAKVCGNIRAIQGSYLWVTLACCLASYSALASDFWSPRSEGLGGAGHAAPLLNDSIYMNPSYTAFLPAYSFSGNYLYYNGSTNPSNGHNWNVSLQDGHNELFQAGAGFTQTENSRNLNLGAAKAAIQQLGFGLGEKLIFPNDGTPNTQDTIFSTTWLATKWEATSLVIDNLLETQNSVARNLYREFTLGTEFVIDPKIVIYVDPHFAPDVPSDQNAWGYEVGVEIGVLSDFSLRLGKFASAYIPFAELRGSGYGVGLGWAGPRFSIDYGFTRALSPVDAVCSNFGFTLYL